MHAVTAHFHRLGVQIDHYVAGFDNGMGVSLRAAHDRIDACDQLVLIERLGHVIVGAKAETAHLGVDIGGAGKDENGRVDPRHPELLQHVEAVHVGKAKVEHDDVVIIELAQIYAFLAEVGRIDVEAFGLEHQLDALRRGAIVLDQQNSHIALLN